MDKSKPELPYLQDESILLDAEQLSLRWIAVSKIPDLLWNENPKSHDLGLTWESIIKNGFADPAKWDANLINRAGGQGALVFGNGRSEAVFWGFNQYQQGLWKGDIPRGIRLDKEGNWYIQCKFGIDAVSEAAAAAFAIDHNILTISGGDYDIAGTLAMFDKKDLARVWQKTSANGESLLTLDGDDLDELLEMLDGDKTPQDAPEAQIDKAEELNKKWNVKKGDLWIIPSKTGKGNHRLLCGDSTKAEDVERLMGGERPLLMVTDPPYGVEYDANWRNEAADAGLLQFGASRVGVVQHDDIAEWGEVIELFKGDVVYCWHAGLRASNVQDFIVNAGFEIRYQIIWAKPHFVIGRGHYHTRHEPCWYAVRRGKQAHWIGANNEDTLWQIHLDKNIAGGHSTQKPLECMERPIRNHEGDVYDPFGGSGTTMSAAERQSRACYMMEIHPPYIAVILQRMVDMGLSPVLES